MPRMTITIVRYHVIGTPHYCLAMFHRNDEWTPRESPGMRSQARYIPDDDAGMAELKACAKKLGFTHYRIDGDWARRTKPRGGKL